MLGRQSYINDLASLDPELYQGLMFLKNYKGNPEELSLNFTVTDECTCHLPPILALISRYS